MEEEIDDASPDQIDRLRKVMEAEQKLAIQDSMEIPDEDDENREKEENERAAAEAAKDLIPDYEIPDDDAQAVEAQVMLPDDGLGKVSDFGSVEQTLHTNSLKDLT